jgi:hypothetical protein
MISLFVVVSFAAPRPAAAFGAVRSCAEQQGLGSCHRPRLNAVEVTQFLRGEPRAFLVLNYWEAEISAKR